MKKNNQTLEEQNKLLSSQSIPSNYIQQYEISQKKLKELQDEYDKLSLNYEKSRQKLKNKYDQSFTQMESKFKNQQDQLTLREQEKQKLESQLKEKDNIIIILNDRIRELEGSVFEKRKNYSYIPDDSEKVNQFLLNKSLKSNFRFLSIDYLAQYTDKSSILKAHQITQLDRDVLREKFEKEKRLLQKQIQERDQTIKNLNQDKVALSNQLNEARVELTKCKQMISKINDQNLPNSNDNLTNQELRDQLEMKQLAIDELENQIRVSGICGENESQQSIQHYQQEDETQFSQKQDPNVKLNNNRRIMASSARNLTQAEKKQNSIRSYMSTEEKQQRLHDFHKVTQLIGGLYSNVYDYTSLRQISKNSINILQSAKIDLSQNVAKLRPSTGGSSYFEDNN